MNASMKALLVNGSPRGAFGCTARALAEVEKELKKLHIDTDSYVVPKDIKHCINCRWCKTRNTFCVHDHQEFGELVDKINGADAVVFGSPVYYGGITSQLKALLTRLLYSGPHTLEDKVVAGVFSSRRAGSTSAMSELNLFFLMHSCRIVGSQYWNEVHGDMPEEVELDAEGLQTMRTLARNIEAMLSNREFPDREHKIHTNFISREYLGLLKHDNELKGE